MQYLDLSLSTMKPLPFYLAMEEYVAHTIGDDDCFFMWQVKPTVIFGRNQLLENEVNIDYCQQNNIQVFRRKSGGGCVYADMQNVMLSLVTHDDNVNLAFNKFINMMLLVLHKMGISAVSNQHNDILIGERKVSGTACYHLPGGSIVHGTLLYDTNMEHMLNAITPGVHKLQAKGIQSVRQRITLLKEHTTMTLDEVKDFIRQTLCTSSRQVTIEEIVAAEEIEQGYLQKQFIYQFKNQSNGS